MAFENTSVFQHIRHAPLGDPRGQGRGAAAAAQFSANKDLSHLFRRRVVHADAVELQQHEGIGRAEGLDRGHRFFLLILVVQTGARRRRARTRAFCRRRGCRAPGRPGAAGCAGNSRRSFPVTPPSGRPGNTRFMLPPSIGEVRFGRAEGRIVHGRQDDDPPGNFLRCEPAGEIEQRDRAFVFVAVVGAGQERRRPLAPLDHGDRDHQRAPSRGVVGIGQLQKAVLDAIGLEVDRRGDRAIAHARLKPSRKACAARRPGFPRRWR